MTKAEMLTILQQDLGEPNATNDRLSFLLNRLNSAEARLASNGIVFNTTGSGEQTDYPIEDSDLIITYAAFLVRKRDTAEGLPRALEWAVHNRIAEQASEVENDV